MPHAKDYARSVLNRVGCGQIMVNGWWVQGLLKGLVDTMPDWWSAGVITKAIQQEMKDMAKEQ